MNSTKAKRDVLLSIRPFYVNKILDGQKSVELRRKFSEFGMVGSTALIYPPDLQDAAVQNVLQQAEALSADWAA